MTDSFIVVSVESKGLQAAITGLNGIGESPADKLNLKSQIDTLGRAAVRDLTEATPVKTGMMAGGWQYETAKETKYEYVGRIVNNVEHARFVLQGTGMFGPNKAMIIAKGQPFRFYKEGKRLKLWEHAGQPPNEPLNKYLAELPGLLIRAVDRKLRGELAVYFRRTAGSQAFMEGQELQDTLEFVHPGDYDVSAPYEAPEGWD